MTKDKIRFSVVIPCFNEESYISKTIDSIKKQDYEGNIEIIVVDNNCTDKTVAICKQKNIKIVNEKKAGVCYARNAGTKAASGEIIISTDADTLHSKYWLSNIDKAFKVSNKIVAVCGPCKYFDGPWWGKVYPYLLFIPVKLISKITGRPFYITATNTAFKKSAFKKYNTTLTQGGDELDLLYNLRKKGKVVFYYTNPVYTSARRLNRGLLYNLFITFLIYYLLAYNLNRIFQKSIIGMAPAFRERGANISKEKSNLNSKNKVSVDG